MKVDWCFGVLFGVFSAILCDLCGFAVNLGGRWGSENPEARIQNQEAGD
jgi:hypothetical protein